jgi:ATP-dependent Clp protease ATP-binding subunit ClpA
LAETGYDEKFGARPLARVIQEHIKKPMADELLFGKLEHGGTARVLVVGEGAERKLAFEYLPAEPKAKSKNKGEDDEDDDDDEEDGEGPALVETAPRKALSAPKDKKERPKTGAVPSVPRRKED